MKFDKTVLFKGIDENDCNRMIECFNAKIEKYRSGEIIKDSPAESKKLRLVLSGRLVRVKYDINGNRTIIEQFEKNDLIGVPLEENESRGDTEIICEAASEMMLIEYSEITKRCSKACMCHTIVVENLLEIMSKKTVALRDRVDVLSQRSISGKLMRYLQLIDEKKTQNEYSEIPFSITELSDYLCVNRSALQRTIKKLTENGELEFEHRKFRIKK